MLTRWQGKAADGETREVVVKGHPLERLQPRLATEIAIASSDEKSELIQEKQKLQEEMRQLGEAGTHTFKAFRRGR